MFNLSFYILNINKNIFVDNRMQDGEF